MQNDGMAREVIALQKCFFNGVYENGVVFQDQAAKYNAIIGKKMGLPHGMHAIITHWQGAFKQQRDGLKQIMDVGFSQWEALLAAEGPKAAPGAVAVFVAVLPVPSLADARQGFELPGFEVQPVVEGPQAFFKVRRGDHPGGQFIPE